MYDDVTYVYDVTHTHLVLRTHGRRHVQGQHLDLVCLPSLIVCVCVCVCVRQHMQGQHLDLVCLPSLNVWQKKKIPVTGQRRRTCAKCHRHMYDDVTYVYDDVTYV